MPLPKLAWAFDGTTTDYVKGVSGSVGGVINYEIGKYGNSLNIKNPSGTTSNSVNFNFSASYSIDLGFSECFWFKCNDLSYLTSIQIVSITYSGFNNAFKFQINTGGSLQFQFQDSVGNKNINMFGPTVGIWYHLAAVGFNGIVAIYVNGAYYAQTAYVQSGITFNNISLGLATHFAGYPLTNGSYDDLRIYDRALTSAQVQSIYNQQGVPGRGAMAYTLSSGPASIIGNVISSNVYTAGRQPDTSVAGQTTYSNVGSYTFTNFGTNIPLTPTTTGLTVSTYFAYTAQPYGGEGLWTCRLTSNTNVVIYARQTGSSDTILAAYNSNISAQTSNTTNIPQVSGYTGNRAAWVAGRKDHIVFTFTNTVPVVGRMYVNGVLNATATSSNVFIPEDGNYTCLVPGNAFGSADANMSVYDFRVVNGILSASQVAMLYRTLSGNNVPVASPPLFLSGTPLFSQLSPSATSSAVGAFSLRAVNGTTAKAVQIKRQSDNATQDFYADRLGNLLTAPVTGQSLANWLGGAGANVVTWYDQSGLGNHATQGTAANQPIIQRATKGPGYACLFSGNQRLALGSNAYINNTPYTLQIVERRTVDSVTSGAGYFGWGAGEPNPTSNIAHNGYRAYSPPYPSSQQQVWTNQYGDDKVLTNISIKFATAATENVAYTWHTHDLNHTARIYSYRGGTMYPSSFSTTVGTFANFLRPVSINQYFLGWSQVGYYQGEIYELLVFTQSIYDLDTSGGLITQIYQNQLGAYGT